MPNHSVTVNSIAISAMTIALIMGAALMLIPENTFAQESESVEPEPAPETSEQDEAGLQKESEKTESRSEATEFLKGPTYNNLRYNDDFSYLDGPEGSYEKDFFDPIKWIHLTDDLTLSLGGDIRGRMEAVTFKRYGAGEPRQDTYFLHRYYTYTDLKYRKLARFFLQSVNAFGDGIDNTPVPNAKDHFDVQQMFFDLRFLGEDIPLAVRVGRQEMNYGNERLVSTLSWVNVQRSWDGVKVFYEDENWNIDAWYVKPVEKLDESVDHSNWDEDFYGLYTTWKGIPNHGIDAYFMALLNDGDLHNANLYANDSGDLCVYTLGSRFFGKTALGQHWWDYDTELSGQWGKFAGDTIHAWSWAAETGYTFSDWPWKPRIGIGFDYATGDNNPFDQTHGTFNPLYPLGHKYFGWLDQVGRQNIIAQNVNLTFRPYQALLAKVAWHTFWLDEQRDALYNAGGSPVRRQPNRPYADEGVGNELDIQLDWALDRHTTFTVGYSHMWTGPFLEDTGASRDPDLFYVMYHYRF